MRPARAGAHGCALLPPGPRRPACRRADPGPPRPPAGSAHGALVRVGAPGAAPSRRRPDAPRRRRRRLGSARAAALRAARDVYLLLNGARPSRPHARADAAVPRPRLRVSRCHAADEFGPGPACVPGARPVSAGRPGKSARSDAPRVPRRRRRRPQGGRRPCKGGGPRPAAQARESPRQQSPSPTLVQATPPLSTPPPSRDGVLNRLLHTQPQVPPSSAHPFGPSYRPRAARRRRLNCQAEPEPCGITLQRSPSAAGALPNLSVPPRRGMRLSGGDAPPQPPGAGGPVSTRAPSGPPNGTAQAPQKPTAQCRGGGGGGAAEIGPGPKRRRSRNRPRAEAPAPGISPPGAPAGAPGPGLTGRRARRRPRRWRSRQRPGCAAGASPRTPRPRAAAC